MAPSATIEMATSISKVEISKEPEKHVHGAQDKTPLEAISHGPLIHPGILWNSSFSQHCKYSMRIPTGFLNIGGFCPELAIYDRHSGPNLCQVKRKSTFFKRKFSSAWKL
jgi:hypothetical protein